jgi:hypothetical protein
VAVLPVQAITRAGTGLTPAYSAAAGGGDSCKASSRTFLHVKNGHSSPQTVTIATPGTVGGLAIADLAVAVPNAAERMIGPIDDVFRDSGGLAQITYSGVTALTIAAIRI